MSLVWRCLLFTTRAPCWLYRPPLLVTIQRAPSSFCNDVRYFSAQRKTDSVQWKALYVATVQYIGVICGRRANIRGVQSSVVVPSSCVTSATTVMPLKRTTQNRKFKTVLTGYWCRHASCSLARPPLIIWQTPQLDPAVVTDVTSVDFVSRTVYSMSGKKRPKGFLVISSTNPGPF